MAEINIPPHVQRMVKEGDELTQRLQKLAVFLAERPLGVVLSNTDETLLQAQCAAMTAYLNVLTLRTEIEMHKHKSKTAIITPK